MDRGPTQNRRRTTQRPGSTELGDCYRKLRRAYGPRGWWPGRSRAEIILGAILTQFTSWKNVERALARLRERCGLRFEAIRRLSDGELGDAIRPAGTYRQKTRRIRAFIETLDISYEGSLRRMAARPTEELRAALLATWGIGPETADCILLYAFRRPVFVIDAYTRRVLVRHGWASPSAGYDEMQRLMQSHLPVDVPTWNDYHAQLVRLGQQFCRTRPRCSGCPLEADLPPGGPFAMAKDGEREGMGEQNAVPSIDTSDGLSAVRGKGPS